MQYRIGEVADFFGLTKEGIRYYERKGIISSKRDEKTGYRYYPRDEITRLKQIRFYQSMGFSLEESQTMIVETAYEQVEQRVAGKLEELTKKEAGIARMKRELEAQMAALRRFERREVELLRRPCTLFLERVPDEASAGARAHEQTAQARKDEKAWIDAMPPAMLFGMHYDRELKPVYNVFGTAISQADALRLGLPVDRAVVLPERLCVCGSTQAPLGEKPDIAHMVRWMRENGYRLCGDVYGALRFTYRGEDGRRWGVHDLSLPVETGGVQDTLRE